MQTEHMNKKHKVFGSKNMLLRNRMAERTHGLVLKWFDFLPDRVDPPAVRAYPVVWYDFYLKKPNGSTKIPHGTNLGVYKSGNLLS